MKDKKDKFWSEIEDTEENNIHALEGVYVAELIRTIQQPCPFWHGNCAHWAHEYGQCMKDASDEFDPSDTSQGCAYLR